MFRGGDKMIDSRSLGEILVEKANLGVKVYVMVWSEKTSGDIIGEKVCCDVMSQSKLAAICMLK